MTTAPSALVDLFSLFTDFDSDAPEPEFVCSTRAWIAETYRAEDGHLHVRLICEHGKDTHWPHTRLTQVPVDSVYDTDRQAATRAVWAQGYKARNGTLWHAEVKDGGRVLRLLLVPMSEEERAAGRPEGVPADAPAQAPAPAAAAPVERVRYFDAPSTMRLGDRWAFVSLGRAYEVRRAGRGQWVVTPWEGGPSVAEGSSKAAAVAAAHEATGGAWDVAEPRVREREGRRAALPVRMLDITCEQVGLSLQWEARRGGGYWAEPCSKCNGSGHISGYEHIDGGRCWGPCEGQGSVGAWDTADAVATVRRMAREERAAVDRRAAAGLRAEWRWEVFAGRWPDVAAWIDAASREGDRFAGEMRTLVRAGREMSEGQRAACRRAAGRAALAEQDAMQREAARLERVRRSRAAGAKDEPVTITGAVTRLRRYTSGPHWRPVTKMVVVVDDGAGIEVVMFTGAAAAFDLEEGQRVTVRGRVKDPENRDEESGAIQSVISSPQFSEAAE
ncbi:hypothetical protein ABT173_22325 [Streptomyces sp. NPDC001795]|uniref:hypothetical protein n=1 Tax=Streptomyces sp. NPDC001795 TaxID=3154525 RepID=UPI00332478A1